LTHAKIAKIERFTGSEERASQAANSQPHGRARVSKDGGGPMVRDARRCANWRIGRLLTMRPIEAGVCGPWVPACASLARGRTEREKRNARRGSPGRSLAGCRSDSTPGFTRQVNSSGFLTVGTALCHPRCGFCARGPRLLPALQAARNRRVGKGAVRAHGPRHAHGEAPCPPSPLDR